jgi:dUTP pyrophosphatase
MRIPVQVKVLDARLNAEFGLPSYGTQGAAGLDLRACVTEPTILQPGETSLVSTGIAMYLADPGYAALVLPRSGLGAKQGIVLGNLVGLIDSDYQGPLMLAVWNRSAKPFTIGPGDRLAQMIIVPIALVDWQIVDEFDASARSTGGFGSTGQQ